MNRKAACVFAAYAVLASAAALVSGPGCGPNRGGGGGGGSLDPKLAWMISVEATESARVEAVAFGAGGEIVIVGDFAGTLTLGGSEATSAGGRDGFIARLEAESGRTLWLRRFGGEGDDRARAVAIADDGAIAFGGELVGRARLGETMVVAAGQPDGIVGVIDKTGSFEWARAIGGTRFAAITGVAFLESGDIAATGSFAGQTTLVGRSVYASGGHDIITARLRRAGGVVWATRAGGPGADIGRAIAALPDGGAVIAGSVMSGADFGGIAIELEQPASDLFVASIDADGAFRWASASGGEQNDSAAAVVLADKAAIAGGRSVPALVRAGERGGLSSATPLPDVLEVTALAFDRRLFAARVVANPIGVGGGVAITTGLIEGKTQTLNLASSDAITATTLAARDQRVVVAGRFRGELSADSSQITSKKTAGFIAVYRWP